MGLGALAGVDRGLRQFNDAFAPILHGVDPSAYVAPVFLLFAGFSFAPTAVARARGCPAIRRILLLNAAAPLALLLLILMIFCFPDTAGLGAAASLLVICAGCVSWISTMLDAAVGGVSAEDGERGRGRSRETPVEEFLMAVPSPANRLVAISLSV